MKDWQLIFSSRKMSKSSAVGDESERGGGVLRSEEKCYGACVDQMPVLPAFPCRRMS